MKNLFQILSLVFAGLLVSSCTKEELNIQDVQNYTDQAMFEIQKEANVGTKGCFEFVWPISVQFEDGTVTEFEDFQSMREGIKEWKAANPEATTRPQLVFPIEIIGPDGTIYTLESKEELKVVINRCKKAYWNRDFRGHFNNACFKVVLPVTLALPNGNTFTFETRTELKLALREWKSNNPDADEHPTLAFPINVLIKDLGETVVVDSAEDLQRLKETCEEG